MKNPTPIHPLIGPHEGRELELMLKGQKPAAMFYYIVGKEEHIFEDVFVAFQPHVDAGVIIKKETLHTSKDYEVRHVYYALPQYIANIERLMEITDHSYDPTLTRPWPDELEYETGRLLGYSDEAIEYFITHKSKL